MKKAILALIIIFSAALLTAQNYNPYVAHGVISQLLPWQLNGTGLASFIVGNHGTKRLPLIRRQEMVLKITLSDGLPDVDPLNAESALTAISGGWVNMFAWSYCISTNTFTGKQKQMIPARSEGTVSIRYKVTTNSPAGMAANGFNVNIIPPGYSNGSNMTIDDAISVYTNAQVSDFGDAPASYGSADHIIDMDNPSNSIYLGTKIDYDLADQPSANAEADDQTGVNDDDGVTFPPLIAGTAVSIPVTVSEKGNTIGFLNAWIDWNGDGDFNDASEQVATNILVASPGAINLAGIAVPINAVTSSPTFARFRIGPPDLNFNGSCSFGEVEDYQVQILSPNIGIEDKEGTGKVIIYSSENNIFIKDMTGKELKGKMLVYNMVGQRVAKKTLTGGTLNKFNMNLVEGYYVVEVVKDELTTQGKVFLTR